MPRPPPHRSRRAVFQHRALQKYSLPCRASRIECRLPGWNSPPCRDPWPWHLKVVEQIVETLPRETAALAPPVQPFPQSPHRLVEKLLQSAAVARYSIVVIVATELELQLREEFSKRHMTALLAPRSEVGQRVTELLPGRPPLDVRSARAVLSPGELKPEKVEPRGARLAVPAEGNHPAFGGGQLKSELL